MYFRLQNNGSGKKAGKRMPFTLTMYNLLEEATARGYDDVISWVPDGGAFKVHKPIAFTQMIAPNYFRNTKFQSFTRQLYLYGFVKVKLGHEQGAFYHPKFHRDDPYTCASIGRLRRKQSQKPTTAQLPPPLNSSKCKKEGTPEKLEAMSCLTQSTISLSDSSPCKRRPNKSLDYESITPTNEIDRKIQEFEKLPISVFDRPSFKIPNFAFDLEPRPIEDMMKVPVQESNSRSFSRMALTSVIQS